MSFSFCLNYTYSNMFRQFDFVMFDKISGRAFETHLRGNIIFKICRIPLDCCLLKEKIQPHCIKQYIKNHIQLPFRFSFVVLTEAALFEPTSTSSISSPAILFSISFSVYPFPRERSRKKFFCSFPETKCQGLFSTPTIHCIKKATVDFSTMAPKSFFIHF